MAKKLVLSSKEDVRQAIRRRGAAIAAEMTDQEFFLSDEFTQYATRLTDFILRNHKLYNLAIRYEPQNDEFTAYTDGKNIAVNAGNAQARNAKLLERRFKVVMGSIFHEAAHKLFLDFFLFNRIMDSLQKGKLYGKFPTNGIAELEQAKEELEQVMTDGYGCAIAAIYSSLSNFVADGHDERLMKKTFKGFITECIDIKNEEQSAITPPINEFIAHNADDFTIYSALCLEYAKYGFYIVSEHNAETKPYTDHMITLEPTLDAAMSEDSMKDRWNWLNLLVLQLWPFLRERFQNQQNQGDGQGDPSQGQGDNSQGQGNNSQGQGSSSQSQNPSSQGQDQSSQEQDQDDDEDDSSQDSSQNQNQPSPDPNQVQQSIQQMMQQIQQMLNSAPAPVNCSGKPVSAEELSTNGADPGAGSNASQIAMQIANVKAESQIQHELDDAEMEAIRNNNVPLVHKKIRVYLNRHPKMNKSLYQRIYKEIAPISRNLISTMSTMLRDRREVSMQYHKRCGPIVVATDAYRPDKAFFAKKKPGENIPNMSIVFLIDQSGSMEGRKLECAKKTAILLEDFARSLDIPIMIAGHTADYCGGVDINIYTDFVSVHPETDRYTLAAIESDDCNRDGLPIRHCCELLAARPENVKLMIVASDGAPCDKNYSGEAAREDIRKTVQEFRRKGLIIYGAAIGATRS